MARNLEALISSAVNAPAPIPMAEVTCDKCLGVGLTTRIDGAAMRAIREKAGWGLRRMAARIGVSSAYLGDMELGRRRMSEEIAREILEVCAS